MKDFYTYKGTGNEIDKDAAWDFIHDGYLLSPRTVLIGRTKLPQPVLPSIKIDLHNLSDRVQEILVSNMGNMAGLHRAIMFSGGFDSIMMALLAQQCGADVTAVTVQFDDFNPLTVAGSVEFANKMGIAHHIIHVKTIEFLSAFEALAGILEEPILDLDLVVVYSALKKYDLRLAGDVFISGMGSDQWFGNAALVKSPGGLAARLDWATIDEKAHQRVAQVHGCKFVFPFLSETMLALSQCIPSALKKDKKLLRMLAVAHKIPHRGLRSEVQVPSLMKQILIKNYGDRAWPSPISDQNKSKGSGEIDKILRQIILGLWLDKSKKVALS